MRLLLAEDESALADWLVRALGQSDYHVDWVADFTWRNYAYIFTYPVFLHALKNSAILGAASADTGHGPAGRPGWLARRPVIR